MLYQKSRLWPPCERSVVSICIHWWYHIKLCHPCCYATLTLFIQTPIPEKATNYVSKATSHNGLSQKWDAPPDYWHWQYFFKTCPVVWILRRGIRCLSRIRDAISCPSVRQTRLCHLQWPSILSIFSGDVTIHGFGDEKMQPGKVWWPRRRSKELMATANDKAEFVEHWDRISHLVCVIGIESLF